MAETPSADVYHGTQSANLRSILRHGVQPSEDEFRSGLESDLQEAASEHDLDFPVARQECVSFYPFKHQMSTFNWVTEEFEEPDAECDRRAAVVVDLEVVSGRVFTGEFDLFSDIIDFQFMDEPDDCMMSESYSDALQQYAESVTEVESMEDLSEACAGFERPEVLVEGGVSPGAISGWYV